MADSLSTHKKVVQKLTQDTLRRRLEQQSEKEKAAKRKREESQNRAGQAWPVLKKISLHQYTARSATAASDKDDCRIRLQQIATEKQTSDKDDCRIRLRQIAIMKLAAATNSPTAVSKRTDYALPQGEHGLCERTDGREKGTAAVAAPMKVATDLRSKIRNKPTAKEETLLVRHTATPGEFLCDIIHLSGSALKKEMLPVLEKQRTSKVLGTGVHHIIAAYKSQDVSKPTVCEAECKGIGIVRTLDCCPGGKPLIDHLAEALDRPEWEKLIPIVETMKERRLPGLNNDSWPSVREVELGVSTGEEIGRAVKWLIQRQEDAVQNYALFLPAADTESISLRKDERVFSFYSALCVMGHKDNVSTAHFLEGVGVAFPVVLMYGFMDWQLHIKIAVEHQSAAGRPNRFEFRKGSLPREFDDLMGIMVPALGQDVYKDVKEFLEAVKVLYGWDGNCKLRKSLDLHRLSMMAGSTQPCSLASYSLTWLGTVMPKHWKSSTGDGLWWKPFKRLPMALQAYLLGDIQQVAIMGWLMVVSWLLHVFPEFHMVNRVTGFDPLRFIGYWTEKVVIKLLTVSATGGFLIYHGGYRSRQDLLEYVCIGEEEKFDVLRFCPDWPAFTVKKEPTAEEVSQYFLQIYPALRRLDPNVFIAMEEINAAMEHSDAVVVSNSPTAASERTDYTPSQKEHGLCSRTVGREEETAARVVEFDESTAERQADGDHPFFSLPYETLTHAKVKRAATSMKPRTLRNVMKEYFTRDIGRAKQMFLRLERDFMWAKHLFCLKTGNKVIDDLKAILLEAGALSQAATWNNPYRAVRMQEKYARRDMHLEVAVARAEARREKAIRIKEQAEKADEDAERKLVLARQLLEENRASSSGASAHPSIASSELVRLAALGKTGHKKNQRQRKQARDKANAERLKNQALAVEQMDEADREEGEGPPSDTFEQLCEQIQEQLGPQEQRVVRIVELPEEVVSVPPVFTVDDDALVITVEDVDMM
jgi:hypothetical protein